MRFLTFLLQFPTLYVKSWNITSFLLSKDDFANFQVLAKLIETTTEWWTEKQEAYVKQAKHEDPIVTTIDVAEKVGSSMIQNYWNVFSNKQFIQAKTIYFSCLSNFW